MKNQISTIIFIVLVIYSNIAAFQRAPSPTFFISCPNIEDSCFYKNNNNYQRPIPLKELKRALQDSRYRYCVVHNFTGTSEKIKIIAWEKDKIISRSDTLTLHTINSIDFYNGPRFVNDEILFQFIWPLIWTTMFAAIEGITYLEDKEYNWRVPVYAFGISFSVVFPFTFRLNKNKIKIAY